MTLVNNRQKATIASLVSKGFSQETMHLQMESGFTQANFISEHTLVALRKLMECFDTNGVFVRQFTDPAGRFNLYSPEAITACYLDDDSVLVRVNDTILRMPEYKPGMKNLVQNALALHEKLTTTPLYFANGTPLKMFDDGRNDFVEHLRELAREFGVETEYMNDINSAYYSRRKLTMHHFFATFLCLSIEFGVSPRKFYYNNFMSGCDYTYKSQTVKFNRLPNLEQTKNPLGDMTMLEWYKEARKKADMAARNRRQAEWKKRKEHQDEEQNQPRERQKAKEPANRAKGTNKQPPSYANTKHFEQPVKPPPSYENTRNAFTVVEENGQSFRRYGGGAPKQGAPKQKGKQKHSDK